MPHRFIKHSLIKVKWPNEDGWKMVNQHEFRDGDFERYVEPKDEPKPAPAKKAPAKAKAPAKKPAAPKKRPGGRPKVKDS